MLKNILKSLTLLTLFFMLTAQQGCQTTSSLGEKKLSPKEQVKQSMILESKTEIEKLGGTPITEDEAKYKGKLGKDKYIQALEKQLAELKAKDEKAWYLICDEIKDRRNGQYPNYLSREILELYQQKFPVIFS